MLQPPLAIAPDLVSLLDSDLDVKVKHGVIGLLRNLSTPPANRPILGQAGVIAKLSAAQIFGDKGDVAEIVQISGINLTKHLCTNNGEFVEADRTYNPDDTLHSSGEFYRNHVTDRR